jgi:hypothetical protein
VRFCELWPKIVNAIVAGEQRLAELRRKRWARFCELWSKIGLNIVTKVFSALPLPRRRPRLSKALLDKLDPPKDRAEAFYKANKANPMLPEMTCPAEIARVNHYIALRDNAEAMLGTPMFDINIQKAEWFYAGLTNRERHFVKTRKP